MPVFFGHNTAELLLEKPQIELLSPSVDQELEHCWASRTDLSNIDLGILEDVPPPYHVLVSSPSELRRWDEVHGHLCRAHLPANAFIEIAEGVFVASPSLCFVQRAEELTLAQTVALGERYCGSYSLDKHRKSGIRKREPLVSLEDLCVFVGQCGRVRGIERARRATSLMLEKAASPMESIARMVFCFPRRLGGFDLPLPSMNYEKTLGPEGHRIANKPYIVIDLYWEDFDFGLEYQGKYAHSSYRSIGADIARQLAAECAGIELQMLTIDQLRNPAQRLAIARKAAKRLGVAIPSDRTFLSKNQRLVDELLFPLGA